MAEEQGTATVESAEDEESEREDEPDEDPAQAQGEQEEDKGDDEDAHEPEAAIHSGEQKASEAAEKIAPGAKESAGKVKGAAEGAKEMVTGPSSTVTKLLLPVAAGAGAAATTYVARRAPSLARQLLPGRGGLADELRDRATGATGWAGETLKGHDRGGSQLGRTRRLPIQRWTDVAVPVETAYERWRNMEDFPRFMLRVLSVEQESDDTLSWQEKIWFSKRSWKARIIDERENERIAWEAMSGTGHSGVVSFHRIDENLTRVMVTLDFHPTNLIERVASGLRFVKRAVESDLARFKAYVELGLADESQQEGQDRRDEQAEGDDRRRVRGKPREARGQRRQTRRRRETA